MFNTERDKKRADTAETLNALSRTELLTHFNISRVAELTRLDTIGVPVFTAVRALSKTIAVHAGKGLDPRTCRAGAIAEAIEFELAEQPYGPATIAQACAIPAKDRLEIEDCFPARASIVNDLTYLAWEEVTNIQNGTVKLLPSDLIWLVPRISEQPFLYLQSGSNGVAAGATMEDAILSGLYEIIERDAWTLHQFLSDNCGVLPKRIPLFGLPAELEELVRKIDRAGLKIHLLDATNDYQVTVINAMLLDPTGNGAGLFSGYGAHLNARVAAIRAITEAIQARACYIAGARDDLFRRQFLLMKRINQDRLDQMFNELEASASINEYRTVNFKTIKEELRYLLRLIKGRGVSEVYVKELGTRLGVHVVRVMSPQCEPYRFEFWKPGLRCLSYAQRKLAELAKKQKVTEPDDDEGEEWKGEQCKPKPC
jgi:ribosomal protein S12 methylthiotransferase accessory factor